MREELTTGETDKGKKEGKKISILGEVREAEGPHKRTDCCEKRTSREHERGHDKSSISSTNIF